MCHHWRHSASCHSAFPSARVSSTRPPATLWGWPCWLSWWETFSIAGSGAMFRNCIPVVLTLFDLSWVLIEGSRCVSNSTSILCRLTSSCMMWVSGESATWDNVSSMPFIFWTRLMPQSMIEAECSGMVSSGSTCFSNAMARAALFVFLSVPSPLAIAHGNGPSGGHRSSGNGGSLSPIPCGGK